LSILLLLLLFLLLLLLVLLFLLVLLLLSLLAAEPGLPTVGIVVGDGEDKTNLAFSCSAGCTALTEWLKLVEETDTDRVYGELRMFEKLVDGSFVGVGDKEDDDAVKAGAVVGLFDAGMGDVMDEIDERLWICCCA
jgi:hypothetical protein